MEFISLQNISFLVKDLIIELVCTKCLGFRGLEGQGFELLIKQHVVIISKKKKKEKRNRKKKKLSKASQWPCLTNIGSQYV